MNKKGQSISINTIIVAAIGLAVLVVLFLVFTGRMGLFNIGIQEVTDCSQGCKATGYTQGATGTGPDFDICGSGTLLRGYSVVESGVRKKCCCSNA